jgi:hypothetical protein
VNKLHITIRGDKGSTFSKVKDIEYPLDGMRFVNELTERVYWFFYGSEKPYIHIDLPKDDRELPPPEENINLISLSWRADD